MEKILIADDEKDIATAIEIYLKAEGYDTETAENGQLALERVQAGGIDLVILDIMMPVMDGITAMAKIREFSNIPIILLTAKSEDTDKVLGLTVGADDYVTKPFNPMELIARVKAQVRRINWHAEEKSHRAISTEPVIKMGGICLDDSAKTVSLDGEMISLTPKEFDILKLLMGQPGHVFSPKDIFEKVWNDTTVINENTVAVHIRHLREKLEIDPANPRYIKVVWGRGYEFSKQ